MLQVPVWNPEVGSTVVRKLSPIAPVPSDIEVAQSVIPADIAAIAASYTAVATFITCFAWSAVVMSGTAMVEFIVAEPLLLLTVSRLGRKPMPWPLFPTVLPVISPK